VDQKVEPNIRDATTDGGIITIQTDSNEKATEKRSCDTQSVTKSGEKNVKLPEENESAKDESLNDMLSTNNAASNNSQVTIPKTDDKMDDQPLT